MHNEERIVNAAIGSGFISANTFDDGLLARRIDVNVPPLIENGRVFISADTTANAFGVDVSTEATNRGLDILITSQN